MILGKRATHQPEDDGAEIPNRSPVVGRNNPRMQGTIIIHGKGQNWNWNIDHIREMIDSPQLPPPELVSKDAIWMPPPSSTENESSRQSESQWNNRNIGIPERKMCHKICKLLELM